MSASRRDPEMAIEYFKITKDYNCCEFFYVMKLNFSEFPVISICVFAFAYYIANIIFFN